VLEASGLPPAVKPVQPMYPQSPRDAADLEAGQSPV
jgi:hypothetical protein